MKRNHIIILLAALLCLTATPLHAQSSTEGKEFWVALSVANAPDGDIEDFEPFIAISAKQACRVVLSNPSTGWTSQPRNLQADSWTVIKDIPVSEWYDQRWTANSASEAVDNKGIRIESTADISVYAAMRMAFSYDATNVLPINAIQSTYIIQDYPTYNSEGEAHSTFVIVATEDNTIVDITPTTPTIKGKAANARFTVNLNKGQTYQVVSTDKQTFSGTRVTERNGKKIAVFSGADFTQIPGGKSARDCLYEQAMPVDYWGTEFVVTRSMEKDANRIRITAQEDGTQVSIDGTYVTSINSGETYEFEMSENLASTEMLSAIQKAGRTVPDIINGDAHYIQTSCPCAVFGYDVSSDYRFKTTEKLGDPSMVWISPLQQRISKITFGACGTTGKGYTNKHYVNVVCLTSEASTFKLQSDQRANIPATFTPVPGNPTYSYARVFLVNTDDPNPDRVYTMTCDNGFIAHVYGSGFNESYAYSVGSSAVKRGVQVDGNTYTDGYRSDNIYCIKSQLSFDAQVGTDVIDKVDWDFGDGISEKDGTPQTTHIYDSPGWYDVTANIYAHKECPETQYPAEEIKFSFYVRRPDTVEVTIVGDCKPWDYSGPLVELQEQAPENCATDNYEIQTIVYGQDTRDELDTVIIAHDSVYVREERKWYYFNSFPQGIGVVEGETTTTNASGCTHIHHYRYDLTILTCLEMSVPNDAQEHVCPDGAQPVLNIPFDYVKGQVGESHLRFGAKDIEITPVVSTTDAYFQVPTEGLTPGDYTAQITVEDPVCNQTFTYDYRLMVFYPSSIFKLKFGNVLAVYLSDFNGGYEFTGYQWYKDGLPIEGATSSIYHTEEKFPEGATYYVMLTRKDGFVWPSCTQTVPVTTPDTDTEQTPAARKIVRNQQLYILRDGQLYNLYGNRVE
ncbi:MAG: PKD domain-containing protein [Paludibacteraceae bacterium]